MSTLSQFAGGAGVVVPALVSPPSGVGQGTLITGVTVVNATPAANTWQTILDVTGKGQLRFAAVASQSTSGGELAHLRITINGTSVERSVASGSQANGTYGIVTLAGSYQGASSVGPIIGLGSAYRFDVSLKIEVKRASTNNSLYCHYLHEMEA